MMPFTHFRFIKPLWELDGGKDQLSLVMKDVSLYSCYYTKEILNELTPHTSTVNVPKRQNSVVLRGFLDISYMYRL